MSDAEGEAPIVNAPRDKLYGFFLPGMSVVSSLDPGEDRFFGRIHLKDHAPRLLEEAAMLSLM
jgi:hypothetical protein